jgi:hypothetical protein
MEKKLKYEAPEKPEIEDLIKIELDTSNFSEPEKAEALIKSLGLSVNDTIKENVGEGFLINPRMVLEGNAPSEYKDLVENVKKVLTEKEKKAIDDYIKRKKANDKIRDEIYYSINKRVDKFYKNGEVRENIRNEVVKQTLKNLKSSVNGFSNTIYHLLSKNEEDYLICYKSAWKNKPIPDLRKWKERNDGEYMVLTEGEADYRANEYLTDDNYLWKQAVEEGRTTDSLNDWAKYVLSMDGRENVLSGYDGREEQEEINGVVYCIYRTN